MQIDHIVALGNAWETGAQRLSFERRRELANDQQKGAGDAATWLPAKRSTHSPPAGPTGRLAAGVRAGSKPLDRR